MPGIKPSHVLGLAILLPVPAFAAAEPDDAIAACARLSSTGDRILCLEDALRRLSPAAAAASVPETGNETLATESTARSPVTKIDTATAAAVLTTDSMAGDNTAIANLPTTPETPSATQPADPEPELGTEQIARLNGVEEEQVRISASIVEHTLVGTGRLRLTLDNGQVWQQTGDDDDRVARRIRGDADIAVEMWQSRSGGYRMHLLEVDRTLRVRRVR